MDIVCITSVDSKAHPRIQLLVQALGSLSNGVKNPGHHNVTLVFDGAGIAMTVKRGNVIYVGSKPGASACRNIGASSIPTYRRHKHVMFIDDDVFMCPDWDVQIESALKTFSSCVISGYSHPFNHASGRYSGESGDVCPTSVLSTVCMAMPWEVWDDVGFFAEPGGPGGSEDVDWCARAEQKGLGFAVVDPQCVIHCGLTSSTGQKIVGYDKLAYQNEKLIQQYRLEGQVLIQ